MIFQDIQFCVEHYRYFYNYNTQNENPFLNLSKRLKNLNTIRYNLTAKSVSLKVKLKPILLFVFKIPLQQSFTEQIVFLSYHQ